MAVWYIVVLYLFIFAVLQFVVYRYLRGRDEGAASTHGSSTRAEPGPFDERSGELPGRADDGDFEDAPNPSQFDNDTVVRRCPHCGTANVGEQVFTYCRNCAHQLGR